MIVKKYSCCSQAVKSISVHLQLGDRTMVLPVAPSASVEELREAAAQALKMDPEQAKLRLRLFVRGRYLDETQRSLSDEGVLDQSAVVVTHALQGGMQVTPFISLFASQC